MDFQQFAGFAIVSVTLAMTPGADWAYCISSGLRDRRIAPAVAGLSAGYLLHTALIVAGLAALIAATPQLLAGLTLLGAAYLLWLGISTLRTWRSAGFTTTTAGSAGSGAGGSAGGAGPALPGGAEPALPGGAAPESIDAGGRLATLAPPIPVRPGPARRGGRQDFFKGLGTSGTNPKALLLYLALIPQFVDANAGLAVPLQTLVLGLSHFGVSVLVYTCVALAARRLLRSRPGGARAVTLASGVLMVCLSLVLLAEQGASLIG
ncbi:LysE family translocator [Arthrobacter sunyaminii]|uniref:LysE family translocator n=1 Tax=Arthrobacter sunyaminii TaxID=2816859 RepID=A0A975PET1_9MICC|nr:LysE family translocator [Arthrobacter sunyaminii]MBO0909663.1 LysE family translocator [Arthrobacter sunyaminii]QWQ36038.1 LysE family translocator [Arthrobacter sunyaminii]